MVDAPATSKRPLLLWFVIVASLLRGIWGLAQVIPFARYLIDGRISSPGLVYLSLTIALLWLVICVGLLRLDSWARIAGIVLAVIGIVLGGRGVIVMMMHGHTALSQYWVTWGFLILNFVVILCLAHPLVKAVFGPRNRPAMPPSFPS